MPRPSIRVMEDRLPWQMVVSGLCPLRLSKREGIQMISPEDVSGSIDSR